MTEDERGIHAHAVALWEELSELINAALSVHRIGGEIDEADIGAQVLVIMEAKLRLVAQEAKAK